MVRRLYALATDQMKSGDSRDAAATLEQVQAMQRSHPGLKTIPGLMVDAVRMKAAAGDRNAAESAAASMPPSEERDEAFQLIAARHARDGDILSARAIASRIASRTWRLAAVEAVGSAQAGSNDVDGAMETAAIVAEPRDRALVLIRVAATLDGTPQASAAAALKNRAQDALSGLDPGVLDPDFTFHLAVVQARLGDPAAGAATARLIRSDADRGRALAGVLAAQAARGDWRRAFNAAESEVLPLVRSYALVGVAEGMVPPSPDCP